MTRRDDHHHDNRDDLTRALAREADELARQPVPPVLERALGELPPREAPPVPVRRAPLLRMLAAHRVAAAVLLGAITATLLWQGPAWFDGDVPSSARRSRDGATASATEAGRLAAAPDVGRTDLAGTVAGTAGSAEAGSPGAAASDPRSAASAPAPGSPSSAHTLTAAAPGARPAAPSPAEVAARRGPPAMVRRLMHPRLPDLEPLTAPFDRAQQLATGAGAAAQTRALAMLGELTWPLQQLARALPR